MLPYKYYTLCLALALLFALIGRNAYGQEDEVVLNEILFYQNDTSEVPEEKFEWIELFNGSDNPVDLNGWTISGQDASALITLPSIQLPPDAYLVVHVATGVNEYDFSDSTGHYYTQSPPGTDLFALDRDGVGLYTGLPTFTTMADFVSWKGVGGAYQPAPADTLAWEADEWPEPLFFNAYNSAIGNNQMGLAIEPGVTIGRDSASTDTNMPEDWALDGGEDAIASTAGKQNYLPGRFAFNIQPSPSDTVDWTLLFYLDGDCYLEKWVFQKMNELELVGSTNKLNIVVMVDFHSGYAPIFYSTDNELSWNPATGAFRFALKFNTHFKRVYGYGPNLQNMILGERNLGLAGELSGFLDWGIDNYPAKKYGLWVFGPSRGWKSSIRDLSQKDELHMHELKAGLEGGLEEKLDILVLHQSQMAMIEVAKQVAAHTKVLVATEEVSYVNNFYYNWATRALNLHPGWTGEEYGIELVQQFKAWNPDFAVSALKLDNAFDNLVSTVSDFAVELREGIEDYNYKFLVNYDPDDNVQIKIREALLATEHFQDTNFIDLSHFAEKIRESGIPPDYRTNAQPLINKIKVGSGVVLHERHGPAHPHANGLSIYFPAFQTKNLRGDPYDLPEWSYKTAENDGVLVKYSSDPDDATPPDPRNHPLEPAPGFLFPVETQWDELLHRYYEPCADAGKDFFVPAGSYVTLDGTGSSDADGSVTKWFWDLYPLTDTDDFNADRDSTDEVDDDRDTSGPVYVYGPLDPGFYEVVLTVWDDHHLQGATHADHFETDQDSAFIYVYGFLSIDTFEILKELTCPGDSDGEVKVISTGGIPPYIYKWSNNDSTQTATGLTPGVWSVTVTDQTGNQVTGNISLGPPPIIPTTLLFPPDCSNHSNGAITISTEGGSPPYDYNWNTGDDTGTIDNLPPGLYEVTITDANGCTADFSWILEADDQIEPVVEGIDIIAFLSEEGTYFIDPGDILISVEDNCDPEPELSIDNPFFDCASIGPNTVILSATDEFGNVGTDEVMVTVIDASLPQVNTVEAVVPIGADGIAWLDPFMVDDGSYDPCGIIDLSVDQNIFDCTQLGAFIPVTLTVTDPSGNTASEATQVFVVDELAPFFITCPTDIDVSEPGPVWYDPPEALDNCSLDDVELESGFAPGNHFPMGETNVTWVAVDSWGNTSSCSFTVTVGQCPSVLVLEGLLEPEVYSSGDSLVSTGTVATSGSTIFTADRVIALKAPFNALFGADFEARIEPCAAANLTDKPQDENAESLSDIRPLSQKPKEELLLYPNPVTAELNFRLKPLRTEKIDMQIRILDPLGRQVHFDEIRTEGLGIIDVSRLPDALYRIEIRWEGQRAVFTFIKIH
jgi:hypothetical protein